MVGATGVEEKQPEADAARAKGVTVGEASSISNSSINTSSISSSTHNSSSSIINHSSISSSSTHNSSSINIRSVNGSNSSTSTGDSNSRTTITREAAVEVVIGAGGGTHSSGALGSGDAEAG